MLVGLAAGVMVGGPTVGVGAAGTSVGSWVAGLGMAVAGPDCDERGEALSVSGAVAAGAPDPQALRPISAIRIVGMLVIRCICYLIWRSAVVYISLARITVSS